MSDPVFALVLVACFFAAVAAAWSFKNLDAGFGRDLHLPLLGGAAAGMLIRLTAFAPSCLAAGIILTVVALYVRLMGRESEPADGMAIGAITGAAAAITLVVLTTDDTLRRLAECLLAGAVAGYGVTFGLTHVREKARQAGVDAMTAVAAVAAAWIPSLVLRIPRVTGRHVAIGAAAVVPIVLIATVFRQWPSIRTELEDESALGFIDARDVRPTAHPLLRLGSVGWNDPGAHRQFVRIANRIALRKRQQRSRTGDVVRLYHLEVIKLRMELAAMSAIDRRMRKGEAAEEA